MTVTPETALIAVWIIWGVSWALAAVWASRAAQRASFADQWLYYLSASAGFALLFFTRNVGSHADGQLRLWTTPDAIGWPLVFLGAAGGAFTWWARLHLGRLWSANVTRKADHRLVDTGPYAIVRHPIYTGMLVAAFALAAVKGLVAGVAGSVLITFGFWIKARLEERFLRDALGTDVYDAYRARTPMLVPGVKRSR